MALAALGRAQTEALAGLDAALALWPRHAKALVIRCFLADSDARSVAIPYRANRAVIFESDLFHETDTIGFWDGYAKRRVNITMLRGRRRRMHEGLPATAQRGPQ